MFRSGFAVFFVWAAVFAAQGQQANAPIAAIESLIRSQQYDQALESARSALQQAPGNFQLWTLEGVVLSLKGRSDGAINAYEKALSLSPNYPAALRGEVQLLFTAQDKRAIPIDVHYPKLEQDQVTYNLPPGFTVESTPQATSSLWPDHAMLKINSKAKEGSVSVARSMVYNYTILDPKDYTDLHDFYQKVATADQQQLVLARAPQAKGN